jgi:hypothetical protein
MAGLQLLLLLLLLLLWILIVLLLLGVQAPGGERLLPSIAECMREVLCRAAVQLLHQL